MADAAEELYRTLNSYSRLEELIANGEAEGLYLECKAPSEPRLTRDQKDYLAKAVSGFSNTAGGVIIFGVSTTKHAHSGLDILTQVEPIGNCRHFQQQVQRAIPILTLPPALTAQSRVLTQKAGETRGVLVTYIPRVPGDPVQSAVDHVFYFRSGDDFHPAPYEVIKRLFAATTSPDLKPIIDPRLVTQDPNGFWRIPIVVRNDSSAVAEHTMVSVEIENASACEAVNTEHFKDASAINPGDTIYHLDVTGVIHRGLSVLVGDFRVKMKVQKRPRRQLRLRVTLYSNRMRARVTTLTLQLAKKGFSSKNVQERFLY
jgi:hypothetical protein